MANLFKSAYTNTQAVFVHTYLGDDLTGSGTRESPYRSLTKALTRGLSIVFRGVINESFTTWQTPIIGDDINQNMLFYYYPNTAATPYVTNVTIDAFTSYQTSHILQNIIIKNHQGVLFQNTGSFTHKHIMFMGGFVQGGVVNDSYPSILRNCTITNLSWRNPSAITFNTVASIITNSLTASNYAKNLQFCVIAGDCVWQNGSSAIIQPRLGNSSLTNINLVKDAYLAAGLDTSLGGELFFIDAFGNQTNKLIYEERLGGNKPNIFNRYDINRSGQLYTAVATGAQTSIRLINTDTLANEWPTKGKVFMATESDYSANNITMPIGSFEVWTYTSVTVNGSNDITLTGSSYAFKTAHNDLNKWCTRYGDVLDFTLNPDPLNEALWASDFGGYVGCFRPNSGSNLDNLSGIRNIDTNGTDIGTGDLMQIDTSKKISFNNNSTQLWNRTQYSQVLNIPRGTSFLGMQGDSSDGSPFGYYVGKQQNLIDTTKVYPGTSLIPGASYKVFNDNGTGISKAIIYNNNSYLPEYTFTCLYNNTDFTLLNTGSGSYVQRINASVLESIEVIPYDDLNTLSVLHPRFSAPIVGQVYCLYYTATGAARYGKTLNAPVLFSHLIEANFLLDFPALTNFTWLTADIVAGSFNNITVNDTTGYPSSGVVYINTLKFVYTSIDGTHFRGGSQTLTAQSVGTIVSLPNAIGRPDAGSRSKIAYYDNWMVSSADEEYRSLVEGGLISPLSTYFTKATPDLRYCKYEINGHFDEPYDY